MGSRSLWVSLLLWLTVVTFLCEGVAANNIDDDWASYKLRYKKKYVNATAEKVRQRNRQRNLELVQTFNRNNSVNGSRSTFFLRDNALADMTKEEYTAMLGYRGQQRSNASQSGSNGQSARRRRAWDRPQWYYHTVEIDTLPSCVNWADKEGWVGPVLDQGRCGSCWAYSAVGSLQAQYYNVSGRFVQLSSQNLIDCSFPEGNLGCSGGNMELAYVYVARNGIESLADYPDTSKSTGTNGPCKFDPALSVTSVNSYFVVNPEDERALQQAVALVGPLSVAVDASLYTFQFYGGDVYDDPNCNTDIMELNHAMLLVGYGVHNGKPYWLVQNSWGPSWGINGYMMLARNGKNTCGIAADASVPIIKRTTTSDPDNLVSGAVVCKNVEAIPRSSAAELRTQRPISVFPLVLALILVLVMKTN